MGHSKNSMMLPYYNKAPLLGKTLFWSHLQLHSALEHKYASAFLCCTAEEQHWSRHQWTQNSEFLLRSKRSFSSRVAAPSSIRFCSLGFKTQGLTSHSNSWEILNTHFHYVLFLISDLLEFKGGKWVWRPNSWKVSTLQKPSHIWKP